MGTESLPFKTPPSKLPRALAALSLALLAASCSLKPSSTSKVSISLAPLRGALSELAKTHAAALKATPPNPSAVMMMGTISRFQCIGLNITGPGIPSSTQLQACVKPGMPPMGVRAGLVDASADSLEVSVPSGTGRVVQVFGVVSAIPCPDLAAVFSGGVDLSQLESPIEIGRAENVDLTADKTVAIHLSLPAAVDDRRKVFCLNKIPTGLFDESKFGESAFAP